MEVATILIGHENGRALEERDKYGYSPLIWAVIHGFDEPPRFFLDKGSDIEARTLNLHPTIYQGTALHHAIWELPVDNDTIAEELLNRGADPGSKDSYGRTPLIAAAMKGHECAVDKLLDKGANTEARDGCKGYTGMTALSRAARNGHAAVLEKLFDRGADIEAADVKAQTSLLLAAQQGEAVSVKLLLTSRANIEAKSLSGLTALELALESRHTAVADLLRHDKFEK